MDYQAHSQAEHYRLLEACQDKEVEKAVALLAAHIETAGQRLVEYLQKAEEPKAN
jgi:DNA-binding GntR family transcriptional regulator